MKIKTRTVRFPEDLDKNIVAMAAVGKRSFSAQVIYICETSIDGAVAKDLQLVRDMIGRAAEEAGKGPETDAALAG